MSAYQSMKNDFDNGEEYSLSQHEEFHRNDKATLAMCYLEDCPLPPLINFNLEMLRKEVEMMTPKEYKLMCDKNFLRDFGIRDKKLILGQRDE